MCNKCNIIIIISDAETINLIIRWMKTVFYKCKLFHKQFKIYEAEHYGAIFSSWEIVFQGISHFIAKCRDKDFLNETHFEQLLSLRPILKQSVKNA